MEMQEYIYIYILYFYLSIIIKQSKKLNDSQIVELRSGQ